MGPLLTTLLGLDYLWFMGFPEPGGVYLPLSDSVYQAFVPFSLQLSEVFAIHSIHWQIVQQGC